MLQASVTLKRRAAAERLHAHALHLIGLLDSKMDSVARLRVYQQIAARRGRRGQEDVFRRMIESDLRHIEWLKEQITREVLGA